MDRLCLKEGGRGGRERERDRERERERGREREREREREGRGGGGYVSPCIVKVKCIGMLCSSPFYFCYVWSQQLETQK